MKSNQRIFYKLHYVAYAEWLTIDLIKGNYSALINLNFIQDIQYPRIYEVREYNGDKLRCEFSNLSLNGETNLYFITPEECSKLVEFLQTNELLVDHTHIL